MSQEDDEKNIELSNEVPLLHKMNTGHRHTPLLTLVQIETCCLKLGYGKWDSMVRPVCVDNAQCARTHS